MYHGASADERCLVNQGSTIVKPSGKVGCLLPCVDMVSLTRGPTLLYYIIVSTMFVVAYIEIAVAGLPDQLSKGAC